jgi:hypothetical protein
LSDADQASREVHPQGLSRPTFEKRACSIPELNQPDSQEQGQ